VVQDLEHDEIDYWSFDAKALLKSAKRKLIMRISIFSSFSRCHWIIYIEDKNWGYNNNFISHWFWSRDEQNFCFWHKNLKILALMGRYIQRHGVKMKKILKLGTTLLICHHFFGLSWRLWAQIWRSLVPRSHGNSARAAQIFFKSFFLCLTLVASLMNG
jgi:hypothetical protein